MRENLTYGLTRVQGKQALIYVLRPCPTLQKGIRIIAVKKYKEQRKPPKILGVFH